MGRCDFLAIAIVVAAMVLAVTCEEGKEKKSVSKCWQCSSNAKGGEFCSDPFNESALTETQKSAYYIDCPAPPNRETPQPNQQTVCRKLKKIQNDTVVIDRNCFWQEIAEPKRACENENLPGYIKVIACELCDDLDGCNHAAGRIQFGPIVALMAISLAIANILSY